MHRARIPRHGSIGAVSGVTSVNVASTPRGVHAWAHDAMVDSLAAMAAEYVAIRRRAGARRPRP